MWSACFFSFLFFPFREKRTSAVQSVWRRNWMKTKTGQENTGTVSKIEVNSPRRGKDVRQRRGFYRSEDVKQHGEARCLRASLHFF